MLEFAESMEKGISANLENLKGNCSPALCAVLEQIILFQHEFEQYVVQLGAMQDLLISPELDAVRLVGEEDMWSSLTNRFDPAALPSALDYAVLWSVHAMLDKASQFYQQASRQTDQPQLRLILRSIAEMKLMLRRRVDVMERIVANQVWKSVGFPPGMLAKE